MFDEIIGQEIPKLLLQRTLKQNRLPSAFLFYGPEGVGKRTTALIFAKAVNCKEKQGDACGVCSSCKKITNENHPDIRVIRPEPSGKGELIPIDTVKAIRHEVSLRPFEGRKRLFLVIHSDRMKLEASNAFLKTLEEPPLDTLFILTSTRPDFLLPTILSRCQKIRFRRLTSAEVERALVERRGVLPNAPTPENTRLLSRLSWGRLGFALNLMGEGFFEARKRFADFFFKLPSTTHLEVLDFIEDQESPEMLRFLFSIYRDLLLLKACSEPLVAGPPQAGEVTTRLLRRNAPRNDREQEEKDRRGDGDGEGLVVNTDLLPRLKTFVETVSMEEILSRIQELETGWSAMHGSVNSRLILSTFLFQHLKTN